MKIVADLHTHTNVSHHALSSFEEMIEGAIRMGHKALAITNHGPLLNGDGAHIWHFHAIQNIPRVIKGIAIISGAEANLCEDGTIDIPEYYAKGLDYIVASIHDGVFKNRDFDVVTNAYLEVLKNPYVNTLGHSGSANFKFDYEHVISKCNEHKKIVEINSGSFRTRKDSVVNCVEIARLCKKHNVPIALTSDAHISYSIGDVKLASDMLLEVSFPEELIINKSVESLDKYFKEYRGIDIFNR